MALDEPVGDKEWQARWDAQTLSKAEVIKADEARLEAAKAAAGKLAEDKGEEKKVMDKVARTGGKGAPKPDSGQPPTKQKFSPQTGGTAAKPGAFNVFQKLSKG